MSHNSSISEAADGQTCGWRLNLPHVAKDGGELRTPVKVKIVKAGMRVDCNECTGVTTHIQ